jgi:hypothetical protein
LKRSTKEKKAALDCSIKHDLETAKGKATPRLPANDRGRKTKCPQEENPMLSEQTLSTLNALKLFGMARGFSERLSHPKTADLSHEEFLGLLVQDEKTYRENLRLKRLLKNAKLKQPAALEDIDYCPVFFK